MYSQPLHTSVQWLHLCSRSGLQARASPYITYMIFMVILLPWPNGTAGQGSLSAASGWQGRRHVHVNRPILSICAVFTFLRSNRLNCFVVRQDTVEPNLVKSSRPGACTLRYSCLFLDIKKQVFIADSCALYQTVTWTNWRAAIGWKEVSVA